MSRTAMMTIGFLLLFAGIQLNLVHSYVLTPRMSAFLSEKFSNEAPVFATPQGQAPIAIPGVNAPIQNSPYQQASYPGGAVNINGAPIMRPMVNAGPNIGSRVISPPRWLCWPFIFLGAVMFLNGATMRR